MERIQILACGTSRHAAQVGGYLLEQLAGIPTGVFYASEFRYAPPPLGPNTLTIGVTQSGETADTLAALAMEQERRQLIADPLLPDMTSKATGIDIGDGHHPLAHEEGFEAFLSAEVRHAARALANHQPRCPNAIGFAVLGVAARITDLGIGERHNLLRVGRIGEDLLVPRHGGIENHFSGGDAVGSQGNTGKEAAVFEGEEGWLSHMRPLFMCFTPGARAPSPPQPPSALRLARLTLGEEI